MKIIMRVLEGPDAGKEFVFPAEGQSGDEPTNILVGRDDVSSPADWRLSKEDLTVSRAHLLLEIRPPNCYVQDNGSKNHVYLRRGNEPERRIVKEMLQNGDRLRLGRTVVGFEIIVHEQQEGVPAPAKPSSKRVSPEQKEPEWYCIRCGSRLEKLPELSALMQSLNFMCPRCQKEVEIERRKAEERSRERYFCSECGKDVTDMARSDGRAAELKDVAMYLCTACGNRARQNKEILGYWVLKRLGAGGMGEVYKVWNPKTGRVAALKKLNPVSSLTNYKQLILRFQREIAIMQELRHPNVVCLYETGYDGNSPVFISEFVPGGDLTQFVDDNGCPLLPPREVVALIAESLVGLQYCHSKGYVHRDLKPENILLGKKDGRNIPKLADFGFARSYEKYGGSITRTGEFAGTLPYMPPEQVKDFKRVKPVSDIYAMGVTIYFLLTGFWPLPDFPPLHEIKRGKVGFLPRPPVLMILSDPRVPIEERRPDLPRTLCRVVNKAIAMEPEKRYQSAEEFREALLKAI